jgi:hypothetical protein
MEVNMKKIYFCFSGFLLLLFCFASTTYACRAPRPSAQTLVSDAEIILRATAIKYIREPENSIRALNEPNNAEIEFRIEEVLKGDKVPSSLTLNGHLTDKDDYNDRPIPYNLVRPGGRGGSCSAYTYKQGAEFLLFLKRKEGKFTIRWYALAPTNEQLHSKDDEWLVWVKNYLQTLKEK